jgi:hypothetical protein
MTSTPVSHLPQQPAPVSLPPDVSSHLPAAAPVPFYSRESFRGTLIVNPEATSEDLVAWSAHEVGQLCALLDLIREGSAQDGSSAGAFAESVWYRLLPIANVLAHVSEQEESRRYREHAQRQASHPAGGR